MTKRENLFVTTMEECAEVQQAISKLLRFGTGQPIPESTMHKNERAVLLEFYQLVAMVAMLQESGDLPVMNPEERDAIILEKTSKVSYYQKVSETFGTIDA